MSWDAFQREAILELGLVPWQVRAPGSEAPPSDPRSLAMVAQGLQIAPERLIEAGIVLPPYERLRDAAAKRALWTRVRAWRRQA